MKIQPNQVTTLCLGVFVANLSFFTAVVGVFTNNNGANSAQSLNIYNLSGRSLDRHPSGIWIIVMYLNLVAVRHLGIQHAARLLLVKTPTTVAERKH